LIELLITLLVAGTGVTGAGTPGEIAGLSAQARPIHMRAYGDRDAPELLVFGCVHGDECAAREVEPVSGCPLHDADIRVVDNLNPDGLAAGTRLNGRGVDLNRNFPTGWKPIGRRGSPQYSGPRPFSEPETRLAAGLIRRLRPAATVWFHQHAGPPFVRAWGQSIPLARRYARFANLPFRRLPWLAGTAPNWQNHAFPGTASFVVELRDGPAPNRLLTRLGYAVAQLAREIGRPQSP
jgi:protein MpaA